MNSKVKTLNSEWVTKSLEYHGQPLQKVWEGEHGIQSLHAIGVQNPDFTLYYKRQKQFVFQDRAKRLKIHSFIAKKANELFATDPAKECARSNDLMASNIANALQNAKNVTGERCNLSFKFRTLYEKRSANFYVDTSFGTELNAIVLNLLGMYADMPPLNIFLPENANRTNLVKTIYSVRK